jgi:transposase
MFLREIGWEVSDAFWMLVEPHVPVKRRDPGKTYARKPGGGRKPASARSIFSAIVYVLRNGLIWNALPREIFDICSSTVHRVFLEWCEAGVFLELWRTGLAAYSSVRRGEGHGPVIPATALDCGTVDTRGSTGSANFRRATRRRLAPIWGW